MARTANQLTVAKNEVAASTVAAKLLDLVSGVQPANALDASALRLVRTHVDELFELAGIEGHALDELRGAGRSVAAVPENGYHPEPVYANES